MVVVWDMRGGKREGGRGGGLTVNLERLESSVIRESPRLPVLLLWVCPGTYSACGGWGLAFLWEA